MHLAQMEAEFRAAILMALPGNLSGKKLMQMKLGPLACHVSSLTRCTVGTLPNGVKNPAPIFLCIYLSVCQPTHLFVYLLIHYFSSFVQAHE